MKKLIAALLLLPTLAFGSQLTSLSLLVQGVRLYFHITTKEIHIVSQGTGDSRDDAVKKALLNATQEAIGTLIISEVTTNADRVVENLALMYSAGVVSQYKVLNCREDARVTCTISAVVLPWSLHNKLQASGTAVAINGSDLYGRHVTTQEALVQRYRMTEYYLHKMRTQGLEVSLSEVSYVPTYGDKVKIQVDYNVTWNQEFRRAVMDYFTKLEKDTGVRQDGTFKPNQHTVYIKWGSGEYHFVNSYDHDFIVLIEAYKNASVDVYFPEAGVCDRFDISNGLFSINNRSVRRSMVLELPPSTVKNLKQISLRLGCNK
jgi:hypothetical protein